MLLFFRDLGDLMSSGCIKSSKYVVIILFVIVEFLLLLLINLDFMNLKWQNLEINA